ncbi:LADA_0G16116g1_1 [Lachancea dasiensis]|uniref:LADA_0G16116g1_1 n=1 Tax=Lachancea dasiensis TaxID=1072105 RepID=A0A1G4JWS5_9SACH|nr:LADA_0G16116g1_1 [Lachancea dasiensis]
MTPLKEQLEHFLPTLDFQNASQFSRISQNLVLDDGYSQTDNEGVKYLCGYNEMDEREEELTQEMLLSRFSEGLQHIDTQSLINVTNLAFWKASSQKEGFHISHALDDNPNSYWQSDGSQPHYIEANFSKRVEIIQLALFLSVIVDESYTPQILKIYAGHSSSDSTLYKTLEVRNLNDWVLLTFADNRPQDKLLKCQYLRIDIPVNHENGKDTHLRGLRVYTPYLRTAVEKSFVVDSLSVGEVFSGFTLR